MHALLHMNGFVIACPPQQQCNAAFSHTQHSVLWGTVWGSDGMALPWQLQAHIAAAQLHVVLLLDEAARQPRLVLPLLLP